MEIKVLASGSSGNCYLLQSGGNLLLIEAGIPFARIQRGIGFRTHALDGCLISHSHGDHVKAAGELMRRGIDCYMSAATADQAGLSGHRLLILHPSRTPIIGDWTVQPFEVQHHLAGALGFVIADLSGNRILYATDTAYIRPRFAGLTHIMIEANYGEDALAQAVEDGHVHPAVGRRVFGCHMSIERTLDMLRANDLSHVREIWLLHLSRTSGNAAEFKRQIQQATGIATYVAGEEI